MSIGLGELASEEPLRTTKLLFPKVGSRPSEILLSVLNLLTGCSSGTTTRLCRCVGLSFSWVGDSVRLASLLGFLLLSFLEVLLGWLLTLYSCRFGGHFSSLALGCLSGIH